ncbi:MAG TPA: 2-oxoacid:acceptor oxidoreductase family protein [Methanoregulaceae archaeon]|nr:2-oxoacid:acceptor oxidoreductase family protein [Methanoregulaceae archaeon]
MFEIRIHSRGGQGGVTAARLVALAAFRDHKYATACPFYGAERRGAPVVSFVRIDENPIKVYSQIRKPDMVVVLDNSVMDVVDVLQGLKKEGSVLLNGSGVTEMKGFKTYSVDLTSIALRVGLVVAGSPILNTPVIGALAKMNIITMESARSAISEMFTDVRNIQAAEEAYREVVL